MSWIAATDPLAMLALQTSVGTPSREQGAVGSSNLDVPQQVAVVGEPVPVLFARRRNGKGGVLISPKATEARFGNLLQYVSFYYHLILCEGEIDSIERRDVYQGAKRIGVYTQAYNQRAGTWEPGNFTSVQFSYTAEVVDPPQYCGTTGTYEGISTLSYGMSFLEETDYWQKQVHCFIRGGMKVQRLFDNTLGPSDNFCDLVRWGMLRSGKVPAGLIDTVALTASAVFLERYSFTCNIYIQESNNIPDFIANWARYFMLRETNAAGKKGLRPALPVTSQGELITDPIAPIYAFTDDTIITGSLEINYTPLSDRVPFVVQVIWRQQDEDDPGIIRTAEIRYEDQAPDGPYESHDLSAVCTNEEHAVRIGAYILSRRLRSTHSVRFTARPEIHNKILKQGDVVRVRVKRRAQNTNQSYHDWMYQVERISKSLAGDVNYECSHFPIDDEGRSLITLDVLAIEPTGINLPRNRTGPNGNDFGGDDRTVPPSEGFTLESAIPEIVIPSDGGVGAGGGGGGGGGGGSTGAAAPPIGGGGGGGGGPDPSVDPVVPSDGLNNPPPTLQVSPAGPAQPGSALVMPDEPCGPGVKPEWRWFEDDELIDSQDTNYYVIGWADIEVGAKRVRGQLRCPDGDWQDTEEVEIAPEPVPTGREVQRYWNYRLIQFGFISNYGGWRDARETLFFEYIGEPYNGYYGLSVTADLMLGSLFTNTTRALTRGSVLLDGSQTIWVSKSRSRESSDQPWTVIEHEQINGRFLS